MRATSWDPEGIFKSAPQQGLIDRKLMGQRMQQDDEARKQVEAYEAKAREELQQKREARVAPQHDDQLVDYLLDTEAPEMEYEVARLRPRLGVDFFATLDRMIGTERLCVVPGQAPDEERLAELEGLRAYLNAAAAAVDSATALVAAPADRLKALLAAPDKKAALLELAGNNEIDEGLLTLLQQNIEGAREAGQPEAADFMQRILTAALRYRV